MIHLQRKKNKYQVLFLIFRRHNMAQAQLNHRRMEEIHIPFQDNYSLVLCKKKTKKFTLKGIFKCEDQ